MVFLSYFLLAVIGISVPIVFSEELPPFCTIRFRSENLGNRLVVQNLAEYEYHVQLAKPIQNSNRPTDFKQNILGDRSYLKDFDLKFPTVFIECTASYIADFEFAGVEAIQYISILKSRQFVGNDINSNLVQNISITAVLTANATGEYVIYSKENPLVRTSYFIFAQTEVAPYLLGRGRRLVGIINNNNILVPCVSSNPTDQISLFQMSYQEKSYVQVVDPGVQYNRKIGFIIPRKRNTANKLLGEYRCTSSHGLDDDYVTIDVTERSISEQPAHPMLHINLLRNGGAECIAPQGSSVQLVKLLANPYEAATMVNCFDRRNKVCGDVKTQVFGVQDSWRSVSVISSFTDNAGLLICYSDKEIISTPFIKALDGVYYKRVSEVPVDQLLRVTVDSDTKRLVGGISVLISSDAAAGAFVYDPRIYYVKLKDGTMTRIGEITYYETARALKFLLTSDVTEIIVNDVLVQTGKTINVAKSLKINRQQCEEHEFRCDSQECIGGDERCDHVIDCNDGISDEENCTNYTRNCLSSEFKCKSGQCIPEFKVCNQHFDCLDHSDEASCTMCAEDYFKCKNGECIRKSYACDNDHDCSDGSDEYMNICHNCNGDANKFKCSVGGCIPRERVCDGDSNCDDKSDESPASCKPYIPKIVNSRSDYSFQSGDDHYLVCEVRIPASAKTQSRFVPTVTWKAPQNIVDLKLKQRPVMYSSIQQNTNSNGSLDQDAEYAFFYRITDFDSYQAGVYVCEAKNDAGSSRRSFTVTVEDCDGHGHVTQRPAHPARPTETPSGGEPGNGEDGSGSDHGTVVDDEDFTCYKPGKHPDPEDCGVYHECIADGNRLNHYKFNCGPGTVYCGQSEHCGWERDCPCYERKFTNKFTQKHKNVIRRRH